MSAERSAERCETCGDVAVAMVVLRVQPELELAICADGEGRHRSVELGIVGPVRPGETLLVHAGVALAREAAER
jgi:hydrogenase maturation factor